MKTNKRTIYMNYIFLENRNKYIRIEICNSAYLFKKYKYPRAITIRPEYLRFDFQRIPNRNPFIRSIFAVYGSTGSKSFLSKYPDPREGWGLINSHKFRVCPGWEEGTRRFGDGGKLRCLWSFPRYRGSGCESARNFLLARFIDDRGGGDGGGGPAEWRIHRASRQILDGEREQEEGGGEKRIRVEGTRFLNSFVRNRYPVPKSASLRDICTHTRVGNREREKEKKTKWFARVHAKWRVGKRGGGKKKEERREEKRERGGGNRYAEFSQWDWKGTILFPVASTRSFHGKLLGV